MTTTVETGAAAESGRQATLNAPFPWFGGKSRVAPLVWERFGRLDNYVEPFAGSLACLLGAPRVPHHETINDKDGFIANFWRALTAAPDEVARYADWPVNENDMHARHAWLVEQREDLTARLEGDPDFFDAKIAGWWVWGISCWIGGGWCSGVGPWHRVDGKLVRADGDARGVIRQLIHLGNAGRGFNKKRILLGDGLRDYMRALAERLRHVRVCCGDWSRVCSPATTTGLGLTGVFLDPPYSNEERCGGLYSEDDGSVATACRQWAIENGGSPKMRIALCGYDTEHAMPDGWAVVRWKTNGGYGSGRGNKADDNRFRETIWFSPHCLSSRQGLLL